ncbi:MAG: helix-turn-helix transcriptional regulator [Actinomycetota bacterium]|nr:helix-turn-helix transcriptional regulator [Actinomycetota bacterium]
MNETDSHAYRELPAPPGLRQALACSWVRCGSGSVRVLPDGCADIVWRRDKGAIVAGPDTGPWHSRTEPGELIVGVRFLPGAGGPALGVPLSELRDRRIAISELGLDPREELHCQADPRAVPRLLEATAARLVLAGPPDGAVQVAALRLLDPTERVEALAADLGFSERQLRRRFLASVGYGPKVLQRVLRLRRFLAGERHDLARAALDAGYADQAHLARECLRLTGLSPSRLP